jgi:hypothetical protein
VTSPKAEQGQSTQVLEYQFSRVILYSTYKSQVLLLYTYVLTLLYRITLTQFAPARLNFVLAAFSWSRQPVTVLLLFGAPPPPRHRPGE